MKGKGEAPTIQTGPIRIAPAAPTAEARRISSAVSEGLATAAAVPGPSLELASLKVKVSRGTSTADIARALRRAVEVARNGRRS
jgi:hypothetical protein